MTPIYVKGTCHDALDQARTTANRTGLDICVYASQDGNWWLTDMLGPMPNLTTKYIDTFFYNSGTYQVATWNQ